MGILDKFQLDTFRPLISIPELRLRTDNPLTMSQLGIVMIVLTGGLVLSMSVFCSEVMLGKGKKLLNQQSEESSLSSQASQMTQGEVADQTMLYYGRSLEDYFWNCYNIHIRLQKLSAQKLHKVWTRGSYINDVSREGGWPIHNFPTSPLIQSKEQKGTRTRRNSTVNKPRINQIGCERDH